MTALRRVTPGAIAWGIAVLVWPLVVVHLVLIRLGVASGRMGLDPHWLQDTVLGLTLPLVGAIILTRQPRNAFAWLLHLCGAGFVLNDFAVGLATYQIAVRHERPVSQQWLLFCCCAMGNAAWVGSWLMPQILPTGAPLPGRWRGFWRLSLAVIAFGVVALALSPGRITQELPVRNPVGIVHVRGPVAAVVGVAMVLVVVGGIWSLVLRFRRSRGTERQQLKLLTLLLVLSPLVIAIQDHVPLGFVLGAALCLAIPALLLVAMLRHRLYDVDRLISRTVSYALLTGVLAAVYVGLVAGIEAVLPAQSSLAVAASTLTVAALFQPLRRRVQHAVDHRFNRARYDSERVVDRFSADLRQQVAIDSVTADLVGVVQRTVQPAFASVWVRS